MFGFYLYTLLTELIFKQVIFCFLVMAFAGLQKTLNRALGEYSFLLLAVQLTRMPLSSIDSRGWSR